MTNGSNLQSAYENRSLWAHRFARLILAGLAVEVIGVFLPKTPFVQGTVTIASASLIWIGVWGDLHFGKQAREAGDAIVADANARAKEAALQLAKFRAPRTLDDAQTNRITQKIEQFAGTAFVVGVNSKDPEIMNITNSITRCLIFAGWVHRPYPWPGERTELPIFPSAPIGVGAWTENVLVSFPMDSDAAKTATETLVVALAEEGIAAVSAPSNAPGITIDVGPKR